VGQEKGDLLGTSLVKEFLHLNSRLFFYGMINEKQNPMKQIPKNRNSNQQSFGAGLKVVMVLESTNWV
jgi:hypothetical protein